MKRFSTIGVAAGLAAWLAMPVQAAPVCLQTIQIDHTSVKDESTVLFYLKNGKIWRNTLQARCPGIGLHGFTMIVHGGTEVCSNQMPIQLLITHQFCSLGDFTPYTPPGKS